MSKENVRKRPSSSTLSLKTVPSRICTKYEKIYEDGPKAKRVIYVQKKELEQPICGWDAASISPSVSGFYKDYTEAIVYENPTKRLTGGKQPHIVNVVPSLTICKVKPPQQTDANINADDVKPKIVHVQLETAMRQTRAWERFQKCIYTVERKRPLKMSRGTQTLYRESSAQTLPYLPGVSNDKETLETLELFKLPKILKGDGPPGVYEVELLERARKRWAFEKALKREFACKMNEARTAMDRRKQFLKHKQVIEAFEWEHWLQREEAIQSYQMMRFDLVIRIFEKREREMHQSSNIRISMRCEQIAMKRDRDLEKNRLEYERQLRRMKIKHEKMPRNWRKEKISDQLGDPGSEYYAPQLRYGVNPNRRHFQLTRKAFEMRMEDLEKRATVNMKNLECPFAKLKQWSKPKELKPEIEMNFCTDTNLKKLYESLKGLREHSRKHKIIPKCLKEKVRRAEVPEYVEEEVTIEEFEFEAEADEEGSIETVDEGLQVGASYSQNSLIEMFSQRDSNKISLAELLDERRREELEVMLAEYEGTKIGWLMRFLSEEMGRLQEQRKLHFITMLAQKERWRREAAEAGLRQKENEMRRIYEDIFEETDRANRDVCEQYLDNIFGIDTREQADFEAATNVTGLARVIDADLQRWVSSFKSIQHPLNYDELRCLLRDLVFPENLVDCLVRKYEAHSVVDYIINDVLFPHIFTLLEPFDVVSPLTSDFVDRLIDNDLYLFSTDCSSGCDCFDVCECTEPDLEAKAIMRKIIRQAVPGRRWRTTTERIADDNVKDIVDLVCGTVDANRRCVYTPPTRRRRPTIMKIPSVIDLFAPRTASAEAIDLVGESTPSTSESSVMETVTIVKYRKDKKNRDSVTRSLYSRKVERTAETAPSSGSQLVDSKKLESAPTSDVFRPSLLRKIPSAFNIRSTDKTREEEPQASSESSETEELVTQTHKHDRRITQSSVHLVCHEVVAALCNEVIASIFPDDELAAESSARTGSSARSSSFRSSSAKSSPRSVNYDDEESISTGWETETGRAVSKHHASDPFIGPSKKVGMMVLSEFELKRILQDDGECKCQMEIDYRNHIKELYESGRIKVIYKEPPEDEEATEKAETEILKAELADMVLEHVASSTGIEQSEYADEIEGEGPSEYSLEEEETEKVIDTAGEAGEEPTVGDAALETVETPAVAEEVADKTEEAVADEAAVAAEEAPAESPVEAAVEAAAESGAPAEPEPPAEAAPSGETEVTAEPEATAAPDATVEPEAPAAPEAPTEPEATDAAEVVDAEPPTEG